ncbi:MAG: hypothetical protein ABS46_01480 [Cytophagaceae bacterium SCN 52-12]|nr:MAG: hypothetical protein ABS46_01480 [Cytophagaceae bacterium SCN 52-12]
MTGQSESALPVTLLSFKAEKQENTVLLTWQTTEEKDFSHFDVERSAAARNWQAIGRVAAKGNGAYTFTDTSPLSIVHCPLLPPENGR